MRTLYSFLGGWTFLLVPTLLVQVQGAQQCFFHDGSLAADDIPCTDLTTLDDVDVPCCGSGRTCLSNRMCSSIEGDPNPSRGSCTDWHWNSPNCPQFCLGSIKGVPIHNCTIQVGVRDSSGEAEYCCSPTGGDCCVQQPLQLFTAPAWNFTLSPTLSSTSSASSATSSVSSTSSSTSSSSAATTTTSAAPPAATSHTSSGTNSTGIGIGVGVGVAVALAFIGTLALFWRRRRRRRGHQNIGSSSSADSNLPSPPPVQERGPAAYTGYTDGRAAEIRSYELESMRKPAELHGSEPEGKGPDVFAPKILRSPSVDKLD